jgi:uncharacterized membrane protein
MMDLDRYISIVATPGSFYSRLPFSTTKSAHLWSIGVICLVSILNSHLLMFNGWFAPPELRNRTLANNQTETYLYQDTYDHCYSYSNGFSVIGTWQKFHVFMSNWIPGAIMLTLNLMLIYKTFSSAAKSSANSNEAMQRSHAKKKRITLTLIAITFAFILLDLPALLMWSIFLDFFAHMVGGWGLLIMSDNVSYLCYIDVFLICFMTNFKFRAAVKNLFGRAVGRNDQSRRSTNVSSNPNRGLSIKPVG